jgi:hypothetical protein
VFGNRGTAVKYWGALVFFVLAAPGIAIEVTPDVLVFRVSPGRRAAKRLFLRNDEKTPLTARVEVQDEGGSPWLTIGPREVRLAPGKSRGLRVVARASLEAAGERSARLVVTVPGPRDSEIRVVRRALLTVVGTERSSVGVGPASIHESGGRAMFTALCRNEGNVAVFLKTGAELDLTNGRKRRAFAADTHRLAPGEEVRVEIEADLTGFSWGRRGRIVVFFRRDKGETQRVEREFGPEALKR